MLRSSAILLGLCVAIPALATADEVLCCAIEGASLAIIEGVPSLASRSRLARSPQRTSQAATNGRTIINGSAQGHWIYRR